MHRLLSRVIKGLFEDTEAERATKEILKQVLENLPIGGSSAELRAGIERSVEQIIQSLSQDDEETMEAMREAVEESLHEIISRFVKDSK